MKPFSAKLSLLMLAMLISAVVAGPSNRHGGPRDLSEEEHYSDGHEHNTQYDHEAFLGKEEAKNFDQLSKEDAKRRLGNIVDKIDKDGDGSVTEKELEDWIRNVSRRYVLSDAESRFGFYDKDNDGFITADEHESAMFGTVKDPDAIYDKHRGLTYKQAMKRYNRRFKVADKDGDGKLNVEEYADFLHPAEVDRMKPVYVDERMEEMDKNKDGKVSPDEYINDLWSGEGPQPDWVETERGHFSEYRDRDKDGYLSKEEVSFMLAPPKFDPSVAEAAHLLREADSDKDKALSKDEILIQQDLFVGSRATNYGNYHDEF